MKPSYGARSWLANVTLLFTLHFHPAAAEARTIRILVLGDSLAAGYGLAAQDGFEAQMEQALRSRGADVRLVDAAVSGDTAAGGRARLDWALSDPALEGGPDAALVELGGNDGLRALPPSSTEANLVAILDTLEARRIPTLLSGMIAPPNLGPEYGEQFSRVFQDLSRRPGLIFDPFFLEGVAGDPALNQADRIHPNPGGVRRVVARLLPLMERLIAAVGAP